MLGGTLILLLLGCGEDRFFVRGRIRGSQLSPGDAVWGTGSVTIASTTVNAAVVVISNSSNLCSFARALTQPRNSQSLTIVLSDRSTNSAPTAPGTFTIWVSGPQPTRLAVAQYSQTDANCQQIQTATATATSGAIIVTSVSSGGNMSGNFDLIFDSGDQVTGSFSATNCSALVSAIGTSTCG
jgi:hypothetical protein